MAHTWWHVWGDIDKRHQKQWNTRDPNQNFYGVNDPRRAVRETTNRWSKKGSEVIDRIPEPVKELVGGVTNVVGQGLFGPGGLLRSDMNALGLQPVDAVKAIDAGFETVAKVSGVNRNVLDTADALLPFTPTAANLVKKGTKTVVRKSGAGALIDTATGQGMFAHAGTGLHKGGKKPITKVTNLTKTISSKNDELSKLSPKEIERRITRLKEVQAQADKMQKGSDNYLSRRSGGTGEPLYTYNKKAKEAAGVPLESEAIQTKFGAERDSPVWQLHHAEQKKYRAAVSERMLELIKEGKATWYDFAAIEAMEESMGLIGVGDSGVQLVPEVAHSSVHTEFKMRGIEPKPGLGSDKTPKKFKPRKIPKHLEGEDLLEGASLDIEIENLQKINTADEMISEVRSALKEVYLPQQQRMIEMTEALQAGFPGLQANMVKNQLARDLLKDIRAGRKPNTKNLSDIELAQQQANYEKLYSEWRNKVEVDMRDTAARRAEVKVQKEDIAQEKAIQGYEPGTPEYEYIEWMYEDELKRTRWRTGSGTQSFGRVR